MTKIDFHSIIFVITDIVIVPDMQYRGFEGWGLIWFAEEAIMYESEVNTRIDQFYIVATVAHEMSHAWCGNTGKTDMNFVQTLSVAVIVHSVFITKQTF